MFAYVKITDDPNYSCMSNSIGFLPQGSYVYFDFVEWVQKNLDSFTFEYKYLEDKEL